KALGVLGHSEFFEPISNLLHRRLYRPLSELKAYHYSAQRCSPPSLKSACRIKKCHFRKSRESRILARSVSHFTLGQPRAAHRLDRNSVVSNKKLGRAPMTVYRALITAAVIFGSLAIAVSSATAQKRYDPGASDTEIKIGNIMPYSGPASSYAV